MHKLPLRPAPNKPQKREILWGLFVEGLRDVVESFLWVFLLSLFLLLIGKLAASEHLVAFSGFVFIIGFLVAIGAVLLLSVGALIVEFCRSWNNKG